MLDQMRRSGIFSNMFTLSSALKACSALELPEYGKGLHSLLTKDDNTLDRFLNVGLIDMYYKCVLTKYARSSDDLMPGNYSIALNAMISGYSQNEADDECLDLFVQMYSQGTRSDQTSLLAVLNSAAGLQAANVCKQVHALFMENVACWMTQLELLTSALYQICHKLPLSW
ncbi:hypothetical protein K7X08_016361 [Anisodus acutangulus]|uniref:Pentatricopeptide repeat-containing protein n=1 Tax=Anisodus acutangulus TaxID=402998 RepID=A0A9Q1R0G0_9SOLA|nr:hypothetical protein K7X08_016361 [Anisodus acutangulus]